MGGFLAGVASENPAHSEEIMISIIIVTFNSEEFIRKCINSILRHTKDVEYEIIVIDNNSQDQTVQILYNEFPDIRLIRNTKNTGFAAANNKGIIRSKGEYIYFLNPDSELEHNAILEMCNFLKRTPDAGAVGSRIEYFDGSLQLSCRRFPNYINVFFGRRSIFRSLFPRNKLSRSYMMEDINYTVEQPVDWVMGASMMVKRDIVFDIGLFDEDYFLFVEDTDLCMRMHKKNMKTYYLPTAKVKHYHGGSVKKRFNLSQMNHNISMYKYYKKYYIQNPLMKSCLYIAVLLRLLSVTLAGIFLEVIRLFNVPGITRSNMFKRGL